MLEKKHRVWLGVGGMSAVILLSFVGYFYFQYSAQDLLYHSYSDPVHLFGRVLLYGIAFLAIFSLRCLMPNRTVPFLTKIGRNSLWIFILHRPFTLLISEYCKSLSIGAMLGIAVVGAFVFCWIFGHDVIAKYMNQFIDGCVRIFIGEKPNSFSFSKLVLVIIAFGFVVNVVFQPFNNGTKIDEPVVQNNQTNNQVDVLYPAMMTETQQEFEYAKPYIESADDAIIAGSKMWVLLMPILIFERFCQYCQIKSQ